MLILTSTDKIDLALGAAHTTNPVQIFVSWRDKSATAFTPGKTASASDGTNDVTIVAAPAADTIRGIDYISVFNYDTVSHTVTIKLDVGGTETILWIGTVLPLGQLQYTGSGFFCTNPNSPGYAINVGALSHNPADSTTYYFGSVYKAPASNGQQKVYIRKPGVLKIACIYMWATVAGTNENITIGIRVNNTTNYEIAAVGVSANERRFENDSLNIQLQAGDYFEIYVTGAAWATNPTGVTYGGYMYIE